MPVGWIRRCRMDLHQYFVFFGSRFFHVLELKNIRWSVFCVDNRFHEFPPGLLWRGLERPHRLPKSYSSWIPEIRLTSPATTSHRKDSRLPTVTAEVLGQPQPQHLQYRLWTVAGHRHHSQRLLDGLRLAPAAALWPTP